MAIATLPATLRKSLEAEAPNTIHTPKGCGEIYPLLAPIPADRTVEVSINTGVSLVKDGDEIVFESGLVLEIETILPIQSVL